MATAFDFVIDGQQYKADKMSAIAQFHLSRKLAPLLPPLAPLFMKVAGANKDGRDVLELIQLAQPFADALSGVSDEVATQLMDMTLGTVKVETDPGTYMSLWLPGVGKAMKVELDDFSKLLPVVLRVIQLNLGPFISGFLTGHGEPTPTAPSGVTSPERKIGS